MNLFKTKPQLSMNILAVVTFVTFSGIMIGIMSYASSRGKKSSFDILNIAIVPVETKDANNIIAISKQLNKPQSLYHLRKMGDDGISDSSLPHCTLMHFRISNDPKAKKDFLEKLVPFVGQTLLINTIDVESIKTKKFLKSALLNGDANHYYTDVKWVSVKKTPNLIELQSNIINAISDKKACFTGTGINYQPHFTLWVKDAAETKHQNSCANTEELPDNVQESISAIKGQTFFGKVVIGTCGPIGQLENILTL
jgi:hypothetical protein